MEREREREREHRMGSKMDGERYSNARVLGGRMGVTSRGENGIRIQKERKRSQMIPQIDFNASQICVIQLRSHYHHRQSHLHHLPDWHSGSTS